MFCNNEHTPALAEFLELIGDKVTLKGFEKYASHNCFQLVFMIYD